MLYKYLIGKASKVDKLRLLIAFGKHGRATQYGNYVWLHSHDYDYIDKYAFYSQHRLYYPVNW